MIGVAGKGDDKDKKGEKQDNKGNVAHLEQDCKVDADSKKKVHHDKKEIVILKQDTQKDLNNPPKESQKSILANIQSNKEKANFLHNKQPQSIKKVSLIYQQTIAGSKANKIKNKNKFEGFVGHTTVIFKRPIIEGSYYLEFKVMPPPLISKQKPLNQQQAWRIGICPPSYAYFCPLGSKNSIGFKLKTGHLVSKSKIQSHHDVSAQTNDTFGLLIKFSSPYKHQNKNQIWEGSFLEVRRNNETVCRYNEIYQDFYCPAFSLFNYGSMEVRINQDELEYLPEGYRAYGEIYSEPILYSNLKDNSAFSQFFRQE